MIENMKLLELVFFFYLFPKFAFKTFKFEELHDIEIKKFFLLFMIFNIVK